MFRIQSHGQLPTAITSVFVFGGKYSYYFEIVNKNLSKKMISFFISLIHMARHAFVTAHTYGHNGLHIRS